LALILRLFAALAIATMFMLGKLASQHGVAMPEIMFWRQIITLPILAGWMLATAGLSQLRTQRIGSHFLRAMVGSAGMFFNFAAVSLLHLSQSTTLGFTAPLFAVIITAMVLREHVGPWRWTAVSLGFVGVLLITQPGSATFPILGTAAGLTAALFNAGISFQIRDLARTESPISVVFYFAVFGGMLMAAFMPFYMTPHDATTWLILLGIGITGTVGQILMTSALRYGSVASVIIMDYSALIWATIYGRTLWGEMPPSSTWIGAPLIIAAGLVITWRERKLFSQAKSTTEVAA
jgi:drug/metabolite transporter (DMT)-like permease